MVTAEPADREALEALGWAYVGRSLGGGHMWIGITPPPLTLRIPGQHDCLVSGCPAPDGACNCIRKCVSTDCGGVTVPG